MPVIIILLLMWASSISACTENANAFSTEQRADDKRHVELSQPAKDYICSQVNCPDHVMVEEFKLDGEKFASMKVQVKYAF